MFPHPELGVPLDRSMLRKRFKRAVKAAKVRDVRFHDLRHTFATSRRPSATPTTCPEQEGELVERAFARDINGDIKVQTNGSTQINSNALTTHETA